MSTATVLRFGSRVLEREFEEIFRDHSQFIYRTAYSVTGNHADAEDVVQSIFVKLLQREMTPRFWKEPRAYLYRAAVNLALNSVRSRRRHNVSSDVETLEAPAVVGNGAEESIQQDLMDAIAKLNPLMVEMLVLRYGHNWSDAEIARMLGKSRGTVAVTLSRARARLKRLLKDGEPL